jgi:tRNA dimethylallyltransferase
MNKLIVILGPTASGKTDLSIKLAKKFNGEVISADSRQIYKGMDIGSGKITKKEAKGVPHYLLDVANPKQRFSVSQYQKLALKAVKNIYRKGKLPFLVGGTGFYIQSIVDGIVVPDVKPDWKLRQKLEKLTTEQMFEELKKIDPKRAHSIDRNNTRRLIRALEIVLTTKKPVQNLKTKHNFDTLQIGIAKSSEESKTLIHKRLIKRLKNKAMINEVKKLRKSGLSWKRLEEFGLEYRFVAQYLQNKITYQEMVDKIQIESEHYAKRQMTWFKRDKKIHWVQPHTKNDFKKILKLCQNFLEK